MSGISHRADGGRTGSTGYLYGNGLSGQRVYDQQGWLLRQELGARSTGRWSSKSWKRHYQYDKNSNLVRRGPSLGESEKSYGYDDLERLEKGSNQLRATEELLRTEEGEVEESSTHWRCEYNDASRPKTVYREGAKVSSYLYKADKLQSHEICQ